ncbi:MAG: ComEA family DNA-binding protein [Eubacterium sp.]
MRIKAEQKKWLYGLAILIILCLLTAFYFIREANKSQSVLSESDLKNQETEGSGTGEEIYVHITGAVVNPGVIKLPAGSRVIDAIEKLGGMTEDADSDRINLASVLKDEDKIHIGTKEEQQNGVLEEGMTVSGKVNVNTADAETLKTLPGVGDVLAKNIIDYREKNGSFKALTELKNVDRIGDKIFEKLESLIII